MNRVLLGFAALLCIAQAQEYTVTILDKVPALPDDVSADSRIIGGTSTTIENFPYAVQVVANQQFCGGTLITARHVLSAAHCFFNYDQNQQPQSVVTLRQITVRAGTTNRQSGGQTRSVSALVLHEAYNSRTYDSDVAVMLLSSALRLTNRIRAASLLGHHVNLADNVQLIHIGWGHTIAGVASSSANVLQMVTVNKINQNTCASMYAAVPNNQNVVTRNMLCAGVLGVGGADACQGDSGGPLILGSNRNIVVGITSWGYGCGDPNFPGVSARVSNFSSWIQTTVQRYNSAPSLGLSSAALVLASILVSFAMKDA